MIWRFWNQNFRVEDGRLGFLNIFSHFYFYFYLFYYLELEVRVIV